MDQQNTTLSDANTSQKTDIPPEGLPVLENKKIITHTMKEDVALAHGQKSEIAGDQSEQTQKPFSADIPPPPLPPSANKPLQQDTFREPIDEMPMERDQPIPIPGASDEKPSQKQFKIYIPKQKRNFNATTIILIAVLTLLIAGGGFGYYWFFIREAAAPVATNTEPTPPVLMPEPQPIIPTPTPPQPKPTPIQPEPTPPPPLPIATSTPPIATSTPPVVVPAPAPIPEPTIPSAIIVLDKNIIIEIPKMDKALAIEKLKTENAKITQNKATIRYAFKISNDKEKRFLTAQETTQMLALALPQEIWQSTDGFDLMSYKNGRSIRYGLIARAKNNKDQIKIAVGKWEATMLDDLAPLYIEKAYVKPAVIAYSENTYLDFYKRYINMPLPDVSLDYAVSDKYFAVTTSKEMIYAILDKTKATSTEEVILSK